MANVTISSVDESDPRRPVAHLSETTSEAWQQAFNDYVAWAKGRAPAPPRTAAETSFATAAQNSEFTVTDARIMIALPLGATYADVSSFIEDAMGYANSQTP